MADRKSSQFLDEDQGFFDLELENYEQKEVVMSRFFVTSGKIDIDREIFNIIHENGLVYNGRLIIKNNFQTTEDAIFACGKICEFSQIYKHKAVGTSLRLDKYNGRELGQKMAKSLLEALDLGYLINQKLPDPDDLPTFYMPVGIGGILPSNLRYYYIKRPDWYKPKICVLLSLLSLIFSFFFFISGDNKGTDSRSSQITLSTKTDSTSNSPLITTESSTLLLIWATKKFRSLP